MRTRLLGAAAVLGLVAATLPLPTVFAGPATADTFDVTSSADSGPNTLRQALSDAASNPGDDTIDIQAGLGVITLATELSWNGNGAVTINGDGATLTGVSGVARALVDEGGTGLTIHELTIASLFDFESGTIADTDAAPIVEQGGALTIDNCNILGNTIETEDGDVAGAVLSEGGPVTVTDCTITGNQGSTTHGDGAGAITSEGGAVVVASSTIDNNFGFTSDGDASGGVLSEGGSVTVRPSTFECNVATAAESFGRDAAGAILSEGDDITINGSAVVGNWASALGVAQDALLAPGNAINGTGNTIVDNTIYGYAAHCTTPPPPPGNPLPETPTPLPAPPHFTG